MKLFYQTVAAVLSVSIAVGVYFSTAYADGHTDADKVLAAVERQSEAFKGRDVKALVDNMAEDFTAYRMTDDGPIAVIQSKAQAEEMLSRTFSGASSYLESEIPETLVVKDIVVQVELDTFQTDEGPKTSTTLAIYHVKDGKMWRSYNFRLHD